MDEALIANWNSKVKVDDTVYFLGDLTFQSKVEKYLSRLNGYIVWIKGNHDKKSILKKAVISYGGIDWELVHNPINATSDDVLCGNVHEKWKSKKEGNRIFINIGTDQWNFTPITIKQIMEERQKWNINTQQNS